jgi:hypothetical protein
MVSASGTRSVDLEVNLVVDQPAEDSAILDPPLPDKISIRVEVNTAQYKLIENRSLTLKRDISDLEPGPQAMEFDREGLQTDLSLPRGATIIRIQPTEIRFQIYGYVTKSLPVRIDELGEYDENLEEGRRDIATEPTEVAVRGPSNVMETLENVPVAVRLASVTPGVKMEVKPILPARVELVNGVAIMAVNNARWKRSDVTLEVPVLAVSDPPLPDGSYTMELDREKVTVPVSWPANLPLPGPRSDGGLSATVQVDFRELERDRRKCLQVQFMFPSDDIDLREPGRRQPSVCVTLRHSPPPDPGPSAQAGDAAPETPAPAAVPSPQADPGGQGPAAGGGH